MWLFGRSPHTIAVYRRFAKRFLHCINKPLHLVTLADIQGWQQTLTKMAPASQRVACAAVKSLLKFAHEIGVLEMNIGVLIRAPKVKDELTERILTEAEVAALMAQETNKRNFIILRLLYLAGLRVSELCALKWKDTVPRGEMGQITVFGKGGKTRTILLPASLWQQLLSLRADASAQDPVFRSRNGRPLDRIRIYRIVQAAASRAGIEGNVSPHWLRHAHASHSLDHGAPLHLTQHTLGHSRISTTERYLHVRPNDSSAMYLPE
ncbi:MAG: tyrosine-type recombinase/integrase [Symploca sp. SIO1C4]|uniref:Tyrosine-type recombinase/integrase n=1 Tax=Symploca sp. SIO1C4 TaxID=2607765 RepID=A0A6B3NDB4_9CYAN|nr:tyrosine-type recombinase/integrase [Symploca sp. SIO1C4]